MALNYLYPNAMKFTYTVGDESHAFLTHTQTIPVIVSSGGTIGADPVDVLLSTRDGGTVNMQSAIENYLAVLRGMFITDTSFGAFELYSYPPDSNDGTFLTSYTSSTYTGGVITVGDPRWTRQIIYTFRTYQGGIAKVNILEGAYTSDAKLTYGALEEDEQDFIDYVLSDDSWLVGRDGGHYLSFLRASGGQNEKLWRIRFR